MSDFKEYHFEAIEINKIRTDTGKVAKTEIKLKFLTYNIAADDIAKIPLKELLQEIVDNL